MAHTFTAASGTGWTHLLAGTEPTRFGTRFIAVCGTRASIVDVDRLARANCPRCIARSAARAAAEEKEAGA